MSERQSFEGIFGIVKDNHLVMSKQEWVKDLIEELMAIEGIIQVLIITDKGRKIWKMSETEDEKGYLELWSFVSNIKKLAEMDLLFDKIRIFVKKIKDNFLIVFATHSTPMAYLRLTCENFIRQRLF